MTRSGPSCRELFVPRVCPLSTIVTVMLLVAQAKGSEREFERRQDSESRVDQWSIPLIRAIRLCAVQQPGWLGVLGS